MLNKQTTLDLNGPVLSFTTNPVGVASTGVVSGTGSGIVTFTGIATALFPTGISTDSPNAPTNPASNTGIITYRWYEIGVGALSDSQYVTGTATTTLTLSRLITPTDNRRQFYLTADYIPSAYQSSSPVTAGTARSTGNAVNEPLSSGIGTLTVYPLIEIVAEPVDGQSVTNGSSTFTVNAGLTDSSFGDVNYQWYVDGVAVDDGTFTTTTTTSTTVIGNQSYTYTSDGSITLPSDATNVELTVAGASGGKGGDDSGGSGGAGAFGRVGKHYYVNGARTLTFSIGRKGNDGTSGNQNAGGTGGVSSYASGGPGGGAGQNGFSGGGGGGGGATAVYDSVKGGYTIVAAGGAGGGGGSLNAPSNTYIGVQGTGGGLGFGRARDAMTGGYDSPDPGDAGQTKNGDGGGGGGGGGGAQPSNFSPSGGGGGAGQDNSSGGQGGAGGASGFDTRYATFYYNGFGVTGDGYVSISYRGTTLVPTTTTRRTTVSGSKTPTLVLSSDTVGVQTVFVRVSNPSAVNSPFDSIIVDYATLSSADQYKVEIESIGIDSSATLSNIDLFNGDYTFSTTGSSAASGRITNFYSFYAPDKDINVEMDIYGGKGYDNGSYVGGEGGFSRIRFTMTKNTEYVIAGLSTSINAPFIYRKGQLIACVGRGGDAGSLGNGGFGGGIGIDGSSGSGRNGGLGGSVITAGSLGSNGIFGSLTTLSATAPDTKAAIPNGGRSIKCTKGVYWQQQGVSACSDVGTTKFRLSDGTEVTNTKSITRGYKAGYSIIQTAGRGIGSGGNGGAGATGGAGGDGTSGGGGGSGYTDGSVTVVTNTLGGSTGDARVVLRVVT